MATFKHRIKEALNGVLRPLGWEFERHVGFGRELFKDIGTISGGRPFRTVFDVGAHQGQTARQFSALYTRAEIYSFEPFKESYEILVRMTEDCRRVTPINLGLSDAPGYSTLHLNRGSATNSILPNAVEGALFQPPEFVGDAGMADIRLTTLDAFCKERAIDFVDLLKIDSQGFEMHILRGAQDMLAAGQVALLYCEINFVPLYEGQAKFQDIFELLLRCGLHLTGLYEISWNEERRLRWCEALFCHPGAVAARFGDPATR